ncbi:5093_t:CDS:2 [Paraglomus brasilianum]|uniref:5093_t:CDS:1 n=1 Tax=Paraglomus brasilianum TaxID=144538 RepID=A0A9N8YVW7_9GLOM|nr:5093_t:CDS:2 [Paraglomus brasilianum]
MPDGSALAIVDLINELKDNENADVWKEGLANLRRKPSSKSVRHTLSSVLDTMRFLCPYGPVHLFETPAANAWKEGLAGLLGLTL